MSETFTRPTEASDPDVSTADPVAEAVVATFITSAAAAGEEVPAATFNAAFAEGVDTTENNPAVSADTATTAMRCFIVLLDICFLSLVEFGNFPISARRSFDLLIPSPLAHTCNAARYGNLFIQ